MWLIWVYVVLQCLTDTKQEAEISFAKNIFGNVQKLMSIFQEKPTQEELEAQLENEIKREQKMVLSNYDRYKETFQKYKEHLSEFEEVQKTFTTLQEQYKEMKLELVDHQSQLNIKLKEVEEELGKEEQLKKKEVAQKQKEITDYNEEQRKEKYLELVNLKEVV